MGRATQLHGDRLESAAHGTGASPWSVGEHRRARLERARLYLIASIRPGGHEAEEILEPALAAGVDIVQLRDKEAADDTVRRAGGRFRHLCDTHGALFIVNDRPDLAIACGADGVHLGQADMDVAQARELVGDEMLIGRSTHSPEQIQAAEGADYIGVGPIFATPTKPGRPAVGVDLVRSATSLARIPFFAIGGIDGSNVDRVVAAGATRVAVVRAICEARDPGQVATILRAHLAV